MNSHEYANKLQQLAAFLLSKPEFKAAGCPSVHIFFWSDKEGFLAGVKALGAGEKKWSTTDLDFIPAGIPEDTRLTLNIQRSAVCRKVQEEKWECEPLLSQAEEAEIGVGSDKWKAHDIQETECGL